MPEHLTIVSIQARSQPMTNHCHNHVGYICMCPVPIQIDTAQPYNNELIGISGYETLLENPVVDPGGAPSPSPPYPPSGPLPTGPNSFVFPYIFTKKHPCRTLAPDPPARLAPPTGNLGSATGISQKANC